VFCRVEDFVGREVQRHGREMQHSQDSVRGWQSLWS
jgi:hypothetical protein